MGRAKTTLAQRSFASTSGHIAPRVVALESGATYVRVCLDLVRGGSGALGKGGLVIFDLGRGEVRH